jgi:hypothetical protein
MKIIAKFAFVLLVAVFVVFSGSTSAKAASSCSDQACGVCMSGCQTTMNSCIHSCTYSGLFPVTPTQACLNQCSAQFSSCQASCYSK